MTFAAPPTGKPNRGGASRLLTRTTTVRAAGASALVGGALALFGTATPLRGPLRPLVPGSIVLLLLGAGGLFVLLRGIDRRLALAGLGCAGTGLALGLVGMAGSALGVLEPNPLARVINVGEHAGLLFIAAGMIIWGIASSRAAALGSWSLSPTVIGLLGLSGVTYLIPLPPLWLWQGVVPLLFCAAWMVLGYAMLAARLPWTGPSVEADHSRGR